MPILPIIARVALYIASMLFGAAVTRLTTRYLDQKKERERERRRQALKDAQRREFSKEFLNDR